MKFTRILTLILALVMVLSLGAFASGEPSADPSGEPSGEARTAEQAYIDYSRQWLQNELLHNDQMTQEQIDNEYMPLIEAGDYESFPASYLFNGWLETGTAMTFEEFAAQYQPASGEASSEPASVEEAYVGYIRQWLENELAHNAQMTQEQIDNEYMPLIEAGIYDVFPVSYLYDGWLETGTAMTFEEFAAQYQPASSVLSPSNDPS